MQKTSKIFLYGDNYICRNLLHELESRQYNVCGIIDKRYGSRDFDSGTELLNLDLVKSSETKDTVIVLCMASGLTHESILPVLIEKGFENIIYLPMLFNRPVLESEKIRMAYQAFMSFCFNDVKDVPKTLGLNHDGIQIIFCNEKNTVFLCRKDILKTARKETFLKNVLPGKEKLCRKNAEKLAEIPLTEFYPYKNLFDYLFGKSLEVPKDYLELQRETLDEQKELLCNRKKLFSCFESHYENDYNFFLYSPANAQWNENGYFNISDGLHRMIYLIEKGKNKVPIVVSNEDFSKFIEFQNGGVN